MNTEHLVRLKLKDGGNLDFFRDEDNTVRVVSESQEIRLPHASGFLTTQLFAMIEQFGQIELEEEPDG